ncbi:MAG: thiamine-phosphate kinase [Alphaproteobacteria bacterium]|nr:thiamine-phosphate kinase [Alphaproteobacteria bacterium]
MDEFERIAKNFAPLSREYAGAFGLTDDAALVSVDAGQRLVITADALVAGIHFLAEDPPDLIARKALRCNLSDLAAKGAVPFAYLQTLSLPPELGDGWLARYADGLAADQREFDVHLIGGDSTATRGEATISITALGRIAGAAMIERRGAAPGHRIFVTGTLGDAALGLMALHGRIRGLTPEHRAFLVDRYRLPRPRVGLGSRLLGQVSAGLDVSDGVVADLGHICQVSGVGAVIEADQVPLSAAAAAALAGDGGLRAAVLTGGDDYELLVTAAPERRETLSGLAEEFGVAIREIGYITEGAGVSVRDRQGQAIPIGRGGYRHF